MKISYNWLKQYIHFNLSPAQLADALTSIGLETGSVEEIESVKGGMKGLVIGKVLTCCPHPNSDHLHLTTVDVGQAESLPIVCGAPNVAAGQTVVVATVGTKLYSGEEEFVIKKSKIRGEESFGMICAEDEIGLSHNHDGIIVLPYDIAPGTAASDYYKIESDFVLEVDITPNRVDAASHWGVARDLAASLKQRGESCSLHKPEVTGFATSPKADCVKVLIDDPQGCTRYSGLTVKNVKVKESPQWLKDRLTAIGLRPINNVVDVTNFVLHETGHPLHAFDLDEIDGNEIHVRTMEQGTPFVTLDGVERKLNSNDLMICNKSQPMCIAGVFGGLKSGVTETTTALFLESACFNATRVRKTARAHALNTDSSFRFERGVDPDDTVEVLKRAALLITELAGGEIYGDIQDVYPQVVEKQQVKLSFEHINSLLGKEIDRNTVLSILQSLEMNILEQTPDQLLLAIPTYRVDVTRPADVIEDILRIYGYNNIETGEKLNSNLSYRTDTDKSYDRQLQISEQLAGMGYCEIMNNSLTKESYYQNLTVYPLAGCVHLANPISADLSVMRQTLLFGGLESIAFNRNRKNQDLKFFEWGNCYRFAADRHSENDSLSRYSEQFDLALWLCGNYNAPSWAKPAEPCNVFMLKAAVESILNRTGLKAEKCRFNTFTSEIFSEGLQIIARNKTVGEMGIVSQAILKIFDINTPVFFAQINWDRIMEFTLNRTITFEDMSKYPAVRRDLSLLIDKNTSFAEIKQAALSAEKKLLKQVTLFDVYEGKNLPEGKKSYAVNFLLQDDEKTLTDKQIDATMIRILVALQKQTGAQIR